MALFGFEPQDSPHQKIEKIKRKIDPLASRFEKIDTCVLSCKLRDERYISPSVNVKVQPQDENFSSYNANQIGNTRYIIAEGPVKSDATRRCYLLPDSTGRFLKNTVFRPIRPLRLFLRIGTAWGPSASNKTGDFFDYAEAFADDSSYDIDDPCDPSQNYSARYATISSQLTYGKQTAFFKSTDISRQTPTSNEVIFLDDVSKETKVVTICDLPVPDEQPFPLKWFDSSHRDDRTTEDHRGWFYSIYKQTENEDIVLHCGAGLGRAPMLGLCFLLLDYFEDVFVDDIEQTLLRIDELCTYLSMHRYVVMTTAQKRSVVEVALAIRESELLLPEQQRKDRKRLPLSFLEIQHAVVSKKREKQVKIFTKLGNKCEEQSGFSEEMKEEEKVSDSQDAIAQLIDKINKEWTQTLETMLSRNKSSRALPKNHNYRLLILSIKELAGELRIADNRFRNTGVHRYQSPSAQNTPYEALADEVLILLTALQSRPLILSKAVNPVNEFITAINKISQEINWRENMTLGKIMLAVVFMVIVCMAGPFVAALISGSSLSSALTGVTWATKMGYAMGAVVGVGGSYYTLFRQDPVNSCLGEVIDEAKAYVAFVKANINEDDQENDADTFALSPHPVTPRV